MEQKQYPEHVVKAAAERGVCVPFYLSWGKAPYEVCQCPDKDNPPDESILFVRGEEWSGG